MNNVVLYGHRVEQSGATGIGFYVRRLVTAIASSDHRGLHYSLGASPEPPTAVGPPAGLEVLRPRVPNSRLSRRLLHLSWLVTGRPTVDTAFGRPDLVHVLYPAIPVPTRARMIFTIHDLMPLLNPEWVGRYEYVRYARSFRQAADQAELLIADSHKTAREIPEVLGVEESRIRVVHLGVDDAFREPIDSRTIKEVCDTYSVTPGRYFLVLGTVSARKNLSVLLEAMANTSGTVSYPVVAVGPRGIGIEQIENTINHYRLQDLVRLAGWLPDSELVPLMRGAAALLHPSRDEGFGLTPLEGMASGVPVAASSAGSIPEVTGDAALLIDPDDVSGWSEAMLQLAENEQLRREMITRGAARSSLFTWERTARQTIDVHLEVLSGVSAAPE